MKLSIAATCLFALSTTFLTQFSSGECPNACSGHGQCGSFDMCTCDRNWQGADCSLRTCPFGLAHVDTPKGDLDASTTITDRSSNVITGSTVYPYGTSEGFPQMADSAGNLLTETGHDYMECSNKGLCDRETGQCECLPGYDGVACQRASCPTSASAAAVTVGGSSSSTARSLGKIQTIFSGNSAFSGQSSVMPQLGECSGHGTCETIEYLANDDNQNTYALWDKRSTMGCKCDPGYGGPDCSERQCKYGIDPLYTDDTTARVTHTTVRIASDTDAALSGKYAIVFYDVHGEDYMTEPIEIDGTGTINGVTHCTSVTNALKALPNGVVPDVGCSQSVITTSKGVEYTLTFTSNPGYLKELEINQYLDGDRPTVQVTTGATYSIGVYTKVLGEFVDHFAKKCDGLEVTILTDSDASDVWNSDVRPGSLGYISGKLATLTTAEQKILKACLSDSDTDPDNNIDVQNWDTGDLEEADGSNTYKMIGAFPHAIKVVPKEDTTGYNKFKYGSYHLVWYDINASEKFRVANLDNDANQHSEAVVSYVYNTKGIVQQMGYSSHTHLQDNSSPGGASIERIVGYFDAYTNRIYTNYDTSCENQPTSGTRNHVCVEKGAKLFVVDGCWGPGDQGAGTSNPFFGGPSVLRDCADGTAPNRNTGNLYTVTKVYTILSDVSRTVTPSTQIDINTNPGTERYIDTFVIEVDANFGWAGPKGDPENSNTEAAGGTRDNFWSDNTGVVTLFHFTPDTTDTDSTYEYVSQCSNRGLCNHVDGLCECFSGYTGDDCSIQSALAP